MKNDSEVLGEALRDILQPFHDARGKVLTAVLQDEVANAESLMLIFGSECLTLQCDPDLDTVAVSFGAIALSKDTEDLTGSAAWSRFIGKEFCWGWLTVNQQGYTDGVLLSFDGVVPEVGVSVVASSFETLEIRQSAA